MRKVIYAMSVSLDGFIEAANGDLSWSDPDEELHRHFNERESEIDIHFYGRRLYENMAAYWGTADQNPSAPQHEIEYARIWQNMPKVVFSTTLDRVRWNSRLVRGDIPGEVNRLKALRIAEAVTKAELAAGHGEAGAAAGVSMPSPSSDLWAFDAGVASEPSTRVRISVLLRERRAPLVSWFHRMLGTFLVRRVRGIGLYGRDRGGSIAQDFLQLEGVEGPRREVWWEVLEGPRAIHGGAVLEDEDADRRVVQLIRHRDETPVVDAKIREQLGDDRAVLRVADDELLVQVHAPRFLPIREHAVAGFDDEHDAGVGGDRERVDRGGLGGVRCARRRRG